MKMIEPWHRHHALQLASELPNGIDDIRIILKLLNELAENFLAQSEPQPERKNVVSLVQGDGRR